MSDERRGPLRPSGPPLGGDREIQYTDHTPWWRRHLPLLLAVVVLLVVVGGITGAVLITKSLGDVTASDGGASSSASPSPSASVSASATTTAPVVPPPPTPIISSADGKVTAVNGTQWTLSVQKGLDITVIIGPTTVFAQRKTVADVTVGTDVTVKGGLLAGVLTATNVMIDK